MERSSLRLGRVGGIPIAVHYSWIFIFGLVTWSLATSYFPAQYPQWAAEVYWLIGAASSLLFFGSVLGHELAHSFVARARGIPVRDITLFVFGGASHIDREADRPAVEFWISVVGPLCSLALAGIFAVIGYGLRVASEPLAAAAVYLAVINVLLAAFNMIPGLPLDGGRVLRSILWRVNGDFAWSTRIASVVGQVVAFGFILAGLLMVFRGIFVSGLWLIFVGWFLNSAASSTQRRAAADQSLQGLQARQALSCEFEVVAPRLPLSEVVQEYILGRALRALPVVDGGELAGIITLSDVKRVPREDWPAVTVGAAMTPRERLATAGPDEPLVDVLQRLDERDVNQLLVIEDGRLIGMVTRGAVLRFLRVRKEIGVA